MFQRRRILPPLPSLASLPTSETPSYKEPEHYVPGLKVMAKVIATTLKRHAREEELIKLSAHFHSRGFRVERGESHFILLVPASKLERKVFTPAQMHDLTKGLVQKALGDDVPITVAQLEQDLQRRELQFYYEWTNP